tara:strand:- start:3605 stop:4210 length:606 start_codon:yes stop_codon:yes gene_type:complete
MIRSVSYNQIEILQSIMTLCKIDRFDADVTYGNGKFYGEIERPLFKSDISPQVDDVFKCSSDSLPFSNGQINSLVFDPPFLTYIRDAREGNGSMVMAKRYGGYWKYDELELHYRKTLIEANRVLSKKGIMVFKCQDIIHNHKMHCTHLNVMEWSKGLFRLKDLFILPAKSRMAIPQQEGTKKKVQKHSRIFHSYFMVLEKI